MLSLLAHGLLLSVALGGQTFGLPGLNFPWKERRLGANDLRILLAPAQPEPPATLPVVAATPSPTVADMADTEAAKVAIAPPAPMPAKAPAQRPNIDLPIAADAPPVRAPAVAERQVRPEAVPRPEQEALEQTRLEQEKQSTESATNREAARIAAQRQEMARQEATRLEAMRQERATQEEKAQQNARLEAARQEQTRQAQLEAARQAQNQLDAARQEAARQEAARQAEVKQKAAQDTAQEIARQEAARQLMARQDMARQDAARQEAARQEAARQEAARQELARQDAAKQDAARQEAARQSAAKQEAATQDQAKQDLAQRERAEQEAKREERLRAIGKQLNAEAAQRDPAPGNPSRSLLPGLSGLRRGWLLGRADPNADLVQYAEAMSKKIEMNMTIDMLRDVVKQAHVQPIVTVAIRADGSVEKVTFVASSGVPAIDESIRKVVASQAPYGAFPPALARQYDVIEIRRTWIFDVAIRLQ
ncbi:TonB C-terminal domain-containing protein [Massilia sp. TWP1-3-3]|uniref:TonB C-terminal domain-containing protein n=1 Tax=Massilia sp. TWP1-3-3 TaxID=2804573 RepID=UPI003CED5595